jgi:mannose-6-phosphate isomerase
MNELFRLKNQIKHYAWGSPGDIPRLLGIDGGGRPWAELWMGVHPGGPSETEFRGESLGLGELISRDREAFLGKAAAEKFGGLPFLFKFLAAEQPLSIQAHPNREQARRGFERENREGIAPDDPRRNYRDSNHKPEILCALSPFLMMCGFRRPREISPDLDRFLAGAPSSLRRGMSPLREALDGTGGEAGALREFFTALFGLSPELREELGGFIKKTAGTGAAGEGFAEKTGSLMAAFARLYPGDPAVIAPLYLNVLELAPGEAVYLEAGALHSYIKGFGIELMANSDNVLRGGLSPKHVDIAELTRVLDFSPGRPVKLKAPEPAPFCYTYPAPCGEFSLSVINCRGAGQPFPEQGPGILAVTQGRARLSRGGMETPLSPGESVFIPPRAPGESLSCSGDFRAYLASLPPAAPDNSPEAAKKGP